MAANETLNIILNILKKGTGGEQAEQELGGVQKAAQMAGAAIAGYLTVETAKAVYEFGKLGAESLRTTAAFEAISGGSRAAADNLEAMQTATRGAVSQQDAMAAANQLMSMGLASNADELQNVTTMAVRLGSAMGRDATASIEEFSLLLSNQSIPRLDTFGISASKVRTRILELQEATPGLSRELAFMQAVTEEGTLSMERLGPAVEDAALSFEQTEAKIADAKAQLAENFAPAVAGFLDLMATGTGVLLNWGETFKMTWIGVVGAGTLQMIGADDAAAALLNRFGMLGDEVILTGAAVVQSGTAIDAWAVQAAAARDETGELAQMASATAAAERDLAAAEAEASKQAANQAKNTADLAESLKDATSQQIASRLSGMLDPEKMGADAYGQAIAEIGLTFGTMDEESIALAENMDELAAAIESGVIPAEDADVALSALIVDARDGEVDIDTITNRFSDMAGEASNAGDGLRDAGRGMQDISDNAGGAISGVEELGGSAGIAAGPIGAFADTLGTTQSKLDAIVAGSPWSFSVIGEAGADVGGGGGAVPIFTPGGPVPTDISPFGIGGNGASRVDGRQYSSSTTIVNNIYDPLSATLMMENQRRAIDRQIEGGF